MRLLCRGAVRSLPLLALFCLVLALVPMLAGCGGGGEPESTQSQAPTAAEQAGTTQGKQAKTTQGQQEGEGAKAPPPTPPEPNPPLATERTPGSKAVAPEVPVTKGGDNSVQAFGTEGEEAQAAQAAATVQAYLDARLAGHWEEACAQASEEFKRQLEQLIADAKAKPGAEKPQGCAATLELLAGGKSAAGDLAGAELERVLSFRNREDGYAYLIYEDGEGVVRFIAMANDDGAWKVNVPEASELATGGKADAQVQ